MSGILFGYPKFRGQDSTGIALSGGKVYTYEAGTTTPKATYTDPELISLNSNPVILDASGEAVIYLSGIYDIKLTDSSDVTQWTMSDVSGIVYTPSILLIMVLDEGDAITTGTALGNVQIPIPSELDSMSIIDIVVTIAPLGTESSSGSITFNLTRTRSGSTVDVTSAVLTIAEGASISGTATISSTNDDVEDGDFLALDCESAGTGAVGPLWLKVTLR